MVPKIIHQIWIGPKQMPLEWMQTWKDKNPTLKYELWTEKRIDELGLKNRKTYDYYVGRQNYAAAGDVVRAEVLERFGGVYLDADLICVNSIENEPFMQRDFFAVPELNGRMNNAVIGSVAGHPIIQEYRKRIGEVTALEPSDCAVGGLLLGRCIHEYLKKDNIEILPVYSFYPKSHRGYYAPPEGKNYAQHLWGATKNIYETH